jgi:hypothetical protein
MKFLSTVSKSALALTLGAALLNTGACDKEELDRTKDQLAKVSSERDQLKGQVTTMQTATDTMKKDLDDAKAQLAKCQPAAAPIEPVAPTETGKKTVHKSAGKAPAAAPPPAPAAPVAPPVDTTKAAGTVENPVAAPRRRGTN